MIRQRRPTPSRIDVSTTTPTAVSSGQWSRAHAAGSSPSVAFGRGLPDQHGRRERRAPAAGGGGLPGLRVGLREPARRLVQPHDGGVDHPDLFVAVTSTASRSCPDASIRRSATGARGPPFGSSTSANSAPIRRACAAAVAPSSPSSARAGIATSWRRLVERHHRAPADVADLLDADQVLAVNEVAEAPRRPRPASARRRPARPARRRGPRPSACRAAAAEPRRRRARSRRPPAGGSRACSAFAPAPASRRADSPRRRACARRSGGAAAVAFQSAWAVAIARFRYRSASSSVERPAPPGGRRLRRRGIEIAQRLAERDLLGIDDAGLEQVGRARRGRGGDVDHLDRAQLVAQPPRP